MHAIWGDWTVSLGRSSETPPVRIIARKYTNQVENWPSLVSSLRSLKFSHWCSNRWVSFPFSYLLCSDTECAWNCITHLPFKLFHHLGQKMYECKYKCEYVSFSRTLIVNVDCFFNEIQWPSRRRLIPRIWLDIGKNGIYSHHIK